MENQKKLTYNDIFNRSVILNALPLDGLNGKQLCDVIMLQVDYGKAVDDFNRRMEEALKKLKAEKYPDFDSESAKPGEERNPAYETWLAHLESMYAELRKAEAAKESAKDVPAVTREILTALCETGVEGEVRFPGGTEEKPNTVAKAQVLRMVAAMIED